MLDIIILILYDRFIKINEVLKRRKPYELFSYERSQRCHTPHIVGIAYIP